MNTSFAVTSSPISPLSVALYAVFSTIVFALFVTVVPVSDTFSYPSGTVFSVAVYVIRFPLSSYFLNCSVLDHDSSVLFPVNV